jgi:hypothetical protein
MRMRGRIAANRRSTRLPVTEILADRALSGFIKSRDKQIRHRGSDRLDVRNGVTNDRTQNEYNRSAFGCIAPVVANSARRAVQTYRPCANCPSCYSVADIRTCVVGQISGFSSRVPRSLRGAYRDRHERWLRDAMDAWHQPTSDAPSGRAKSCCPDSPTPGSSSQAILRATVTKQPGTPRRPRISRKPLRGECRLFRLNLW